MAMSELALGVDIGGTKLAAGLVEPDGTVVAAARTPTDSTLGDEGLWLTLRRLVDHLLADADRPELTGIGVGSGGPMVWPAGEISPLNIPAWRDFPMRARLQETYSVPVRLINDAIALAIAEHWVGGAQGCDNFLGMVVSTGVGGGLILNGKVVTGGTGNAGHIGHVVAEPEGPMCECGAIGCVEAIASGPKLTAWALANGWIPREADPIPTAEMLTEDARAGDLLATAALARAGNAIGIGLASLAATCDIDLVRIGGGVSNAGALLLDPLRSAFRKHAGMGYVRRVSIELASSGPHAGIVGAAALILRPQNYWPDGI
jgi:glucokinase